MSAGIIWEIFLEEGYLGLGLKDGWTFEGGEGSTQSRGMDGGKGQNRWWDVDQAWPEQRDEEEEGTRTGHIEHLSCQA